MTGPDTNIDASGRDGRNVLARPGWSPNGCCVRWGTACGLSWISLRYFNVAGCAHPSLAERGGTGLFQTAFRQALAGRPVQVTGSDFPTRDGTGIRDYVHVADVALAHAAAIRHLTTERCADIFNVGSGNGYSDGSPEWPYGGRRWNAARATRSRRRSTWHGPGPLRFRDGCPEDARR
jgi:hypothetical protein